jgi:hypothetical protein
MITTFKIFENSQEYYFLNLDDMWNTYNDNFNKIHPDTNLRKKDIKTRCYYYREEVPKILIGKIIELIVFDNNGNKTYINGEISDVWTRYSAGGFITKWQYKFKINNKWYIVKNHSIKIFNTKKTELEETLELYMSTTKFNL